MNLFANIDNALITIYGDTPDSRIAKAVTQFISEREIRILTPHDYETLEQSALNSSFIIIGLRKESDHNLRLASRLKDNRMIVADIMAFCLDPVDLSSVQIMAHGFSSVMSATESHEAEFRNVLIQRIVSGNRRLSRLIQEEEYRRVCDALSCAPASMIIFDKDKRAVFVSDHYYRAYPKIAPRLIRGLSVYDAFDMMMKEEGIPQEDERFSRLQWFWHNLTGSIEFKLDSGTVYRLKAVQLPNRRGTVIMGQNISDYHNRHSELAQISEGLKERLERLNVNNREILDTIKAVVEEFEQPLKSLVDEVKGLQKANTKLEILDEPLGHIKDLYQKARKLSDSIESI